MQVQEGMIDGCCIRKFFISLPAFWFLFLIQNPLLSQQTDPCHFDYGYWSSRQSMPGTRTAMDGEVISGRIYVIGGMAGTDDPAELKEEVWSYDPGSDKWDTSCSHLPEPRALFGDHTCVLGGKLYVIGGTKPNSEEPVYSARVDVYDPVSDTWQSGADLPVPVGGIGVCVLNGQIYVCGGISRDHQPLRSLYRYDPGTDTWHREPDMPTPRYRHVAAAVEGKLYAMGGISDPSASAGLKLAEVYDPLTQSWSPISSLPTQICEMASCVQGEDIYLFGGKVTLNAGILNTVLKYHISTDSWRIVDNLPGQLCLAAACVTGRRIYFFGGTSSREPGIARAWAYDLSEVVLEREIPDLLMDHDSLRIDLSQYFTHATGGKIEYAVCEISDPTIASTWIYDTLIIIKGIGEGEVSIQILAESGQHRAGDSFNLRNLHTSSLPPNKNASGFNAFPNPASDYLQLEIRTTEGYMLSIITSHGRPVMTKQINDPIYSLNISSLPEGLYFIRAWNCSFVKTEKLIKR